MKVVTAVVNNPKFIEIQYYTLKKYFKGDYEFIVFNDAKDFSDFTNGGDITVRKQIEDCCNKLNITCINIPNHNHMHTTCAAIRCADSNNFILNYQRQTPDKYLIIDSDMFLIDYFDIDKYSNYDSAIVLQTKDNSKINYFWNGIYYFDMIKMNNNSLLNWNCCEGCDVGGMMQEWLKKQIRTNSNDNLTENILNIDSIYFIRQLNSCNWGMSELPNNIKDNTGLINLLKNDERNQNNKFFCEIYDNVFFHYRAGGNWRNEGMNFHKSFAEQLMNVLVN